MNIGDKVYITIIGQRYAQIGVILSKKVERKLSLKRGLVTNREYIVKVTDVVKATQEGITQALERVFNGDDSDLDKLVVAREQDLFPIVEIES